MVAGGHVEVHQGSGSKSRVQIGLFHNQMVWKSDWVAGPPPLLSFYSHHSLKWPSYFAVLVLDTGSGAGIWGTQEGGRKETPPGASLPMHMLSSLAA